MKCEMCTNFDPARWLGTVKGQLMYLCEPCARDVDALGWCSDLVEVKTDEDWEND